MLANNLTVADEEAVQAELLEMQREAVRLLPLTPLDTRSLNQQLRQLGEVPEVVKPLDLPVVPQTEPRPVAVEPEGQCSALT